MLTALNKKCITKSLKKPLKRVEEWELTPTYIIFSYEETDLLFGIAVS